MEASCHQVFLTLRTSCLARTHSFQQSGVLFYLYKFTPLVWLLYYPNTYETINWRWPSVKLKARLNVTERKEWRGIEKVSWLKNLLLWVIIAWACQNILTVFCLLITYDCRNAPLIKPVSLLFLGKRSYGFNEQIILQKWKRTALDEDPRWLYFLCACHQHTCLFQGVGRVPFLKTFWSFLLKNNAFLKTAML